MYCLSMYILQLLYTAISRKVVGKSARDNPERYCGWFEFTVVQRSLRKGYERPRTYVCGS